MAQYLSQVTNKRKMLPPLYTIHGLGGVGKTTLAGSMPKCLMAAYEEGLGILDVPSLPAPESYAEGINQLVELANEKHDYRSLGIDTIDRFESHVWDKVCEDGNKPNIEAFGYGKGYTLCDALWIQWFRCIHALREKGMTVMILCHSEDKVVDDPLVGSYTRRTPKLHKRANALLYELSDVVGYLEIERIQKDAGKEGGRQTRTSQTTGQRLLHLEDGGGFVAKNRYDLPAALEIPKQDAYSVLRAELLTALGLDKPKKTSPKEAA